MKRDYTGKTLFNANNGDFYNLRFSNILEITNSSSPYSILVSAYPTVTYDIILPSEQGLSGQLLITDGIGNLSWISPGSGGVGSVTSVGISAPSYLGVSGSPITTSGTITFTPLTTGSGNLVLDTIPTINSMYSIFNTRLIIDGGTDTRLQITGPSSTEILIGVSTESNGFFSGTMPGDAAIRASKDVYIGSINPALYSTKIVGNLYSTQKMIANSTENVTAVNDNTGSLQTKGGLNVAKDVWVGENLHVNIINTLAPADILEINADTKLEGDFEVTNAARIEMEAATTFDLQSGEGLDITSVAGIIDIRTIGPVLISGINIQSSGFASMSSVSQLTFSSSASNIELQAYTAPSSSILLKSNEGILIQSQYGQTDIQNIVGKIVSTCGGEFKVSSGLFTVNSAEGADIISAAGTMSLKCTVGGVSIQSGLGVSILTGTSFSVTAGTSISLNSTAAAAINATGAASISGSVLTLTSGGLATLSSGAAIQISSTEGADITAATGLMTLTSLTGGIALTTSTGAINLTTGTGLMNLVTGGGAMNLLTGGGLLTISLGAGGMLMNVGVGGLKGNVIAGELNFNTTLGIATYGTLSGTTTIYSKLGNVRLEADNGAIIGAAPLGGYTFTGGNFVVGTTNGAFAFGTGDISLTTNKSGLNTGPGNITLQTTNAYLGIIELDAKSDLRLWTQANVDMIYSGIFTLNSKLSLSTSAISSLYTWTFPASAGTIGQLLTSGGVGAQTWTSTTGTGLVVLNTSPTLTGTVDIFTTSVNPLNILNSTVSVSMVQTFGKEKTTNNTSYSEYYHIANGSVSNRLDIGLWGAQCMSIYPASTYTLPSSGIVAFNSIASRNCLLQNGSPFVVTLSPNAATSNYTWTFPATAGTTGQFLTSGGGGALTWSSGGLGTVTSVAVTVPSFMSVSGSPITSSGTITITASSTGTGSVALSTSPTFSGTVSIGGTAGEALQMLNSSLAANSRFITLGKAKTKNNTGIVEFVHVTDGSVSNRLDIGLWGSQSMSIYPSSTYTLPLTGIVAFNSIASADCLLENGSSFVVTLSPNAATTNYTWEFPATAGTTGQFLASGGGGALTWSSGGSGTVTSVAVSAPSYLGVSGSPITSSGTITFTPLITGTGDLVLNTAPTITNTILTGNTAIVSFGGTIQIENTGANVSLSTFVSGNIELSSISQVTISGTQVTVNAPITRLTTSSGTSTAPLEVINPIQTTGTFTRIYFGRDKSTSNCGSLAFHYNGAGSGNNYVAFGQFGAERFLVYPGVNIGTIPTLGSALVNQLRLNLLEVNTDINVVGTSSNPLNMLNSSLSGSSILQTLGKSKSANNTGFIEFYHVTDGSVSNRLDIGLWGAQCISIYPASTYTLPSSGIVAFNSIASRNCLLQNGSPFVVTLSPNAATANYTWTFPATAGTTGQFLTSGGGGALTWTSGGSGTVTSVAVTVPSFMSVSGSPITSSGTIAITASSTGTGSVALSTDPTFSGTVAIGGTSGEALQMLNSSLAASSRLITLGKAKSANNTGVMEYFHVGDGSTSNRLDLGLWAAQCMSIFPSSTYTLPSSGIVAFNSIASRNCLLQNGSPFVVTLSPNSATSNYTWLFPATAGTTGQMLTSGGGGALTWTSTTGTGNVALSTSPTFTGTVAIGGTSGEALQMLNSSLSANSRLFTLGKAKSTNNTGYMEFFHVTDGSASNRVDVGLWGGGTIRVYPSTTYALPSSGTLAVNILASDIIKRTPSAATFQLTSLSPLPNNTITSIDGWVLISSSGETLNRIGLTDFQNTLGRTIAVTVSYTAARNSNGFGTTEFWIETVGGVRWGYQQVGALDWTSGTTTLILENGAAFWIRAWQNSGTGSDVAIGSKLTYVIH